MSKSQKNILKSAKELFWKFGISRVSVDEICSSADLSKMTFYRYYKNKYELAKVILEELSDQGIANYRKIMSSDHVFPIKMELLMKYQQEEAKKMSLEFLNDLYSKNENTQELRQYLETHGMKFHAEISEDFQKAKDAGYIRENISVSFIMHMFQVVRTEMQNPQLRANFSSPEEMSASLMDFVFYGILSKDKSS